jgi:hypothetical protein
MRLLAFAGAPDNATWLPEHHATALLTAEPSGNVAPDQARALLAEVVGAYETLTPTLEHAAAETSEVLLSAHVRVREGARLKGVRYEVVPQLPVDLLGAYVFLPRPAL